MSKSTKMFKFHRRDSLHDRLFELIIHAKANARVFPTSFAVILSAVALFIVLIACENSHPSSLPARVVFREEDVCDSPQKIPY